MRIYTRTGDSGETGLLAKTRVAKNHVQIEALGTLDELNAVLGLARATGLPHLLDPIVASIQNDLFALGAQIAAIEPNPKSARTGDSRGFDPAAAPLPEDPIPAAVEPLSATPIPKDPSTPGQYISEARIKALEDAIDWMVKSLPPLKVFILPGGTPAAAQLHLARCVCRRAERRLVTLATAMAEPSSAIAYLNRLGDFLFTAARFVNHATNTPEVPWHA